MASVSEYRFPILTIKEVKPFLQKGEFVLSYLIIAITESGKRIKIYDNSGLNLSVYAGIKMESLLEVARGEFEFPSDNEPIPNEFIKFQYKWQRRLFEYFPELVKIIDAQDDADLKEEQELQESFDVKANKLFSEWGINGLRLGVHQDKPVFESEDGYILVNEYEFEDDIEDLELDQEVYIRIDEVFLRGIRPYVSPEKQTKQAQTLSRPESKLPDIQSTAQPEMAEKRRGRSRFFID